MARPSRKKSLFRRILYFVVMLISGGGAGVGGWALRDHPILQAVLGRVVPTHEDGSIDRAELKAKLTSVVSEALKRDDGRKPGVYRVQIAEVRVDPGLFKEGRTVDLQARVRRRDASGKETTVWESRPFGENLAQVGRDELSANWSHRPFEIEWAPGDSVYVEVWDRRSGFFDRKALVTTTPDRDGFPLASGPHPLSLDGVRLDANLSRIVFQSQWIGDVPAGSRSKSPAENAREVAERPIVIR